MVSSLTGSEKPKRRWIPYLIVAAIVLAIAAAGYWLAKGVAVPATGGRFGRGAAALTMPVAAAKATTGDIHVVLNEIGTVTPLRNVTVTAQVSGQLQTVNFTEGQWVKQGDLLAQIDPRTYQAALTQAEGAFARDQATLANSKIDLDRYQTLFKQDSIAKQTLDAQVSQVHQNDGTVKADQGQIDTAKVNLAYTKILAPITGRVGLRQIDPGNNVAVGSTIVVVTQVKPIDVLFSIPQDNLPTVLKAVHAGDKLAVDAYDRDNKVKLASGTLASLDNIIDTSTGTVKAKAEFPNDDEALFPNQFVNARILLDTVHDATTIPTSALERGSGGLFVYVVQEDKTVAVRNIKTGPTEGEKVQVTDGLQVGELVVTSGADRLREGSKVELPGDNPQPSAATATANGNAPHRQWQRGEGTPGQGNGQHHRRDGDAARSGGNGAAGAATPADAKPATNAADGKSADSGKQ